MFLQIEEILTDRELSQLQELSTKINFVDGKSTNPETTVKNNLQAEFGTDHAKEVSSIVGQALYRKPEFLEFTFIKIMAPPLMSKYEPGMHYGDHADVAILAFNPPIRSDISMTLFLNEPESYEGGELQVRVGDRKLLFKGRPGEAIIYPSTTPHQVLPVTSGERLVCITFIQSHIKDQYKRDILYNLNEVYAYEANGMSQENRMRIDVVRNNLKRMWAES